MAYEPWWCKIERRGCWVPPGSYNGVKIDHVNVSDEITSNELFEPD